METTETKFQDEHGNEIQLTRRDSGQDGEVIIIKHDSAGSFISHEHYFYSSDEVQSWSCFSGSGEIISRHVMEYGTDVWDAWQREFDGIGQLMKQTFYTWDKKYQAKAELYYDAAGEYLGKKVDSLEGGKYRPLHFDREGNLLPSDRAA
jgi:hypothetical protein